MQLNDILKSCINLIERYPKITFVAGVTMIFLPSYYVMELVENQRKAQLMVSRYAECSNPLVKILYWADTSKNGILEPSEEKKVGDFIGSPAVSFGERHLIKEEAERANSMHESIYKKSQY